MLFMRPQKIKSGGIVMKLTGNKTKKQSKKQVIDALNVVKKLKDDLLEINLKDLEWQETNNFEENGSRYFFTKMILENKLQVRIQIFIKAV